MSAGRHGTIAMRNDGHVRMTVRPEPKVLDAQEIAMIVGYELDIDYSHTKSQVIQRVWDWEHNKYAPSRITAKVIKQMCQKNILRMWYGSMETFDGDAESHRVLLELVHDRMPRFRKVEAEWNVKPEDSLEYQIQMDKDDVYGYEDEE